MPRASIFARASRMGRCRLISSFLQSTRARCGVRAGIAALIKHYSAALSLDTRSGGRTSTCANACE